MYSQCPDCLARFRVTAEALRAARGTVRCGRCGSAFDALERLSDAIPPAVPAPSTPAVDATDAAAAEPGSGTAYHFSVQDLDSVFVEATDWRDEFPGSTAATGEPQILVEDEGAPVEDITLEGEQAGTDTAPAAPVTEVDLDSTDELEILQHVPDSAYPELKEEEVLAAERELETLSRQLDVAEPVPQVAPPADTGAPATPIEPPAAAPAEESPPLLLSAQRWRRPLEEEEEEAESAGGSAVGTIAWSVGSVLLLVVLAAQAVHHFRQDLARHPQVGPPLRLAYERLGLALQPDWDLAAIELRQWGNDAAGDGGLVVRASLTNRAEFAQPQPILRLELEDRFGATVATRDFEPADYLKDPADSGRLLAPGASSEAELVLADPGRDAVGYRLDVCLRESPSQLRCARGPG
jgi:predicted Zn finger-like uncharacterized protein